MDHPSAPIVIISAPGAVGKSALAKFIASDKQCHLWDLSKLTLGANTFRGTLARSFDPDEYSALVSEFRGGRVLFVLDAFDEAEISSGWPMVERFLKELFDFVKGAPNPCLILLARSETAQYMDMHLEILADEEGLSRCHVMYTIDYFRESQAKDFIDRQLDRDQKTAHQQHRGTFTKTRDQVFGLFYRAVGADDLEPKEVWKQRDVYSFLGYAPVLQAVARYLGQDENYARMSTDLSRPEGFADGAALVEMLMKELLVREQAKLIEPIKRSDIPEARGWNGWGEFYTPLEQAHRLFLCLQANDRQSATSARLDTNDVPPWLIKPYAEALGRFLPNHPFIANDMFAGPAFQDFTFAILLASGYLHAEVKAAWHQITSEAKKYVSSPLFALLFEKITNGQASGDLAGYLCESAISQHHAETPPRILIVPREDHEGDNVHLLKITSSGLNGDQESELSFELSVDEQHPVTFPRRLTHAFVEVRGTLVLGQPSVGFELVDVEILCDTLEIRTNTIVIRNYRKDERVSIEARQYVQQSTVVSVDCNDANRVNTSWPDGQLYPWAEFYCEQASYRSDDQRKAALALRRILSAFRKDKKQKFARYKLLVDNVIVGRNPERQLMRDYLIEKRILTHREPLYYLEMEVLEACGVNWIDLRQGTINELLERFIVGFLIWDSKR